MKNNQRVMIFVVIAIFVVSVFGSAILILADNGGETVDPDLRAEAEEFQRALEEQNRQEELAQACGVERMTELANPGLTLPEYDIAAGPFTELESIDVTVGSGAEVQPGACIIAQYHGTLTDGTVFDSTYEGEGQGVPIRFSLLNVIPGWQEGLVGMKEGGVRVLNIPSDLAYGPNGSPPVIGPDEDLVFVVELVEVVENE